jgi:hypothetical protein
VRKLSLVLLVGMLAASVVAVVQGEGTGWFWGGVAVLGIVGAQFARRSASSASALRLYSMVFCLSLLAVAVLFLVLAATTEQDRRGTFIGLAILWFFMAGGAGALVIGLERRLRRASPRPDRSSPPAA